MVHLVLQSWHDTRDFYWRILYIYGIRRDFIYCNNDLVHLVLQSWHDTRVFYWRILYIYGIRQDLIYCNNDLVHLVLKAITRRDFRVEEIMQVGHYGQAAVGSVVGSWC